MITHEIIGDDMQAVVFTMGTGDEVRAQAGAMTYMTDGIGMDARLEGGIMGGLKRAVAGQSLFLTFFKCSTPAGKVAFSAPYPGKIITLPLSNSAILCQRDSLLCATGQVDITVEFTKRLGAGFFGGEGFILERLQGTGDVFAHSGGTIVQMDLKPGEKLKVDTGCLVAFDPTIDYDVEFVGGIKTALFGGEGLFFAAMTGPGRVWIQTLPFSRLADRVLAAFHGNKEEVTRGDVGGALGGALGALGGLIGGDR
ncbi:MAG TPA: TIGR00266 family protein [Vicinamibacterales bacterium]|jgi:uncharacterized protein (TIGR00266 family)|nr:TIGR00266 family protein [Vicinamibacterales bacterium]